MQERADRINFPSIDSELLWGGVCEGSVDPTPRGVVTKPDMISTPSLGSPDKDNLTILEKSGGGYFQDREKRGIVTPAKTPSDILRRGPLYAESDGSDLDQHSVGSEVSEHMYAVADLTNHKACLTTQSTSPDRSGSKGSLNRPPFGSPTTEKQILYHRHRQEAIRKSMLDFETKMTKLLLWHRDQERILMGEKTTMEGPGCSGRSSSSGSSCTLRRGRSKLSEKLYAAIDNNSN